MRRPVGRPVRTEIVTWLGDRIPSFDRRALTFSCSLETEPRSSLNASRTKIGGERGKRDAQGCTDLSVDLAERR